ncbi:MAG: hypothetical protein ABJN26_13820 [Stappiaceae bacterium]
MSDKQVIQHRAAIVLTAIAIVFALVLSVSSLDVPVRQDLSSLSHAQPTPPSLQKSFLR